MTLSPSPGNGNSRFTKLNIANTFGAKNLIHKFYEGDNESFSDQVKENNNASDNEIDQEVSDFIGSEHSSDESLP